MGRYLLSIRLKTLTAAVVPVLVGSALAFDHGSFQMSILVFTLLSALCIQIATNLFNDAIDFSKGADTADRIGPKRVTQSGLISEKSVWFAAFTFLALAVGFGIPLVYQGGVSILVLGLVSLFLAYAYTGGPFPLAYLGLGDVFVILFFGIVAVAGTYFLHSLRFDSYSILVGFQVGLLATSLIAINNLRDSEGDSKVGKRTLAVLFGDTFVRYEIAVLCLLPYLLCVFLPGNAIKYLPLVSLPLATWVVTSVFLTKDKSALNKVLAKAAATHLFFGLSLCLVFIIGVQGS